MGISNEKRKEYNNRYFKKDKEKVRKTKRDWNKKNQEKMRIISVRFKKNNPDYMEKYLKEWINKNPEKNKAYHLKDKINNKAHHQIRKKTYMKYGKLPNGMEYHHSTEPYNTDVWIGVYPDEHKKFERYKQNG